MTRWRVGVDLGGTFTDICLVDGASGMVRTWKVPSSPDDPSRAIAEGVIEGLAEAADAAPADTAYFGHGTTVGTNALIQHRGAATGLITTQGFRDLLEIGRQRRPHLYDLQVDKPPVLVAREFRIEVPERLLHDGSIETPLDEAAVRVAARKLKAAGVAAIAICFLYSYLDPRHEQIAKRIVQEEAPELFVTASHELAPEFREYERLSTAVVNAYLGPVMERYIHRLDKRLDEAGVRGPRHITQSNGGVMSLAAAAREPVRTVLSGPSTGVIGATRVAALSGLQNLITFDMGGTSTDVALIADGQARLTGEMEVHGYPLKTPMLDIHTVGAGGGSIAYVDAGGLLKVGPRSAGAVPGPVCYGLGNEEPTVTDANVLLQTLNPRHLLAGRMAIDQAKAGAAIERLGDKLGLDAMATAQGIISVVTSNMAKAIRVISVQRGHDPRDYTLVAFGGAGPLHAGRLVRELEIPRILVPRNPGIMCALGLLLTDLKTTYAQTRIAPLTVEGWAAVDAAMRELEARAAQWFEAEGLDAPHRAVERSVDVRYAGQNYEIAVPVAAGLDGLAVVEAVRAGFEAGHRQLYGYVLPDEPIQVVTVRLAATGRVQQARLQPAPPKSAPVETAISDRREVWLPELGGYTDCPVYDRNRLGPGHEIAGPAIIEQMDLTCVVLPGQSARIDAYLNVLIEG